MYKLLLVGGTALLITACASTPPTSKASPAAAANAQSQVVTYAGTKEDDQNNMVCISSQVMDSHIPQRVCMTKAQMAARQKAAQEAMRNMQAQGAEGSGAGACSPKCL